MDFQAFLDGNWLLHVNDWQLQLPCMHDGICKARQGERHAAVHKAGPPGQVSIDYTEGDVFIKTQTFGMLQR